MNISQNAQLEKLHNRYTIKVIDADTGQTLQEATAKNVVLNQFYHHLAANKGNETAPGRKLHFGSGTGTISATRTALFTQTAEIELTNVQMTCTDDLATLTGKITLGESDYVGTYIREVGLSTKIKYPQYMLLSHALLEDSEGNPISIGPKTNTQIIELYATLYIQRSSGMLPFPNNLSRIFTDGWAPGIYALAVQPQGIALDGGTYDSATKTWTSAKKRIATEDGNAQGVMTHIIGGAVSEPIMLNDPDVFPVYTFLERSVGSGDGTTKTFTFTPGLIKPNTEVIKVAGVTQTRDVDYKVLPGSSLVARSDGSWRLPYGGVTPDAYTTNANKEKLTLLGPFTSAAIPGGNRSSVLLDCLGLEVIQKMTFEMAVRTDTSVRVEMCFSQDLVTWSPVINVELPYNVWTGTYLDFSHIEPVRYIWLRSGIQWSVAGNPRDMSEVVIYGGSNIVFTTPPANGAAITAKWDVDVPPKDDKLFYDVQVAYTATW